MRLYSLSAIERFGPATYARAHGSAPTAAEQAAVLHAEELAVYERAAEAAGAHDIISFDRSIDRVTSVNRIELARGGDAATSAG
jgi:hypothetical protein